MKNMQIYSTRGVILSLLLIASLFTVFSLNEIIAQEKVVDAKSLGFEETTIIEFENKGKTEIKTFRMWLGSDNSFKSFKTEKGWTGNKTPQGVIIFSTSDPIKSGESVKFGVKTEKEKPGINWKAVDKNDNELQVGKTLVTGAPSKPTGTTTAPSTGSGILSDSSFRLVPEKPNLAATFRVAGEKFSSNHELEFHIGNTFMTSFKTNPDGHFVITSQLPETLTAERVDFKIKDKQGNEKSINIRIGEGEARISEEQSKLTISGLPPVINPGDVLLISGTGSPGGTVTATIIDPEEEVITTNATEVDPQGKWTYDTIVPLDRSLGKYTVEISDGKDSIVKTVVVESSKTIHITPSKIKYEAGDVLYFNGTAIPNQDIELILENPQGSEVYSDIIKPKADGFFEFEFETQQSALEGTYALIAFQGEKSEIILVGIGELPQVQLVVKTDKLNYKSDDKAIVSLIGPESSSISLLIVDPSDKTKFTDNITLQPDGKKEYELDLSGYASGVYTIVVSRGNADAEEIFSVGLQTGSGEIKISTTRTDYKPGDSILVLGESAANVLITLDLIDQNGTSIKTKQTFTNKEGVLSEGSFRVPTDAQVGTWKIKASSGPNFDETTFAVVLSEEEKMTVLIDSIIPSPNGDLVTIKGFGAAVSQTIIIDIISPDEEEIDSLTLFSTGSGDFSVIWAVPNDLEPGTYTIKAHDAFNTAETTLEI